MRGIAPAKGLVQRRLWMICILMVGAAGCRDDAVAPTAAAPDATRQDASSAAVDPAQVRVRPEEAEFARLARKVPGAAGFFLDETGDIVVYLTDPARSAQARAYLQPRLRPSRPRPGRPSSRGNPAPKIVVRQGQYEFFQLAAWRDQVTDAVLPMEGVVFTDLNEGINRVQVGVVNPAAGEAVQRKLTELGVPLAAVDLAETDSLVGADPVSPDYNLAPLPPGQSLQDHYRPLRGGLEISFHNYSTGQNGVCTLGALISSGTQFITNSHCTAQFWSRDSRSFYQDAVFNSAHYIGYESYDPAGQSCYFIYKCRNSDAAIVTMETYPAADFGYIMRTLDDNSGGRNGGRGSLIVDQSQPRFRIVGRTYGQPYQGQQVDKMGRTTGWTWGEVLNTCADSKGPGYRIKRCQVRTTYYSDGGDSGSPVFDWKAYNYGDDVVLLGIHFASANDNSYAVYSPMYRIDMDLGTLSVHPVSGGGGGDPRPPPLDCTIDPTMPC